MEKGLQEEKKWSIPTFNVIKNLIHETKFLLSMTHNSEWKNRTTIPVEEERWTKCSW